MSKPTPHRNAEAIRAFAEGKTVQYRYKPVRESGWFDYKHDGGFGPWGTDPAYEWRVKPEIVKVRYRVGIFGGCYGPYVGTVETDPAAKEVEKHPYFIRWSTEWKEEDVEVEPC